MRGVVVELSAQRFGIPFECPCCGATPPGGELAVKAETNQPILFPYCKRCLDHVAALDASGMASALAMVATLVATIAVGFTVGWLVALAVFAAGSTGAWFLRTSRRNAAAKGRVESCAATGVAITARGFTGSSHAFTFESPTFAARFAEENKSVLASPSPQLQRLLDGYQKARLAIPTPAVAAGIAPPPLDHVGWLARIESTPGTFARRVQLSRALDMIEEGSQRRELIKTVARLELAPTLSAAARQPAPLARELIRTKLADVREDNLSEDLLATQVSELESRLAELAKP